METKKLEIQSIDSYISLFPSHVQEILQKIRSVIAQAAPTASETINYQMPTFVLNGNLVHFAAYKKHIGFYPTPSGIEQFSEEIKNYKWAKGSVQFPLNQPIPYDLIRRMVEFRLKENTK